MADARGTGGGGCTDEAREKRQSVTGLLGTRGEHAGENFLGMSAGGRAVTTENLAVDHGGTDGLLGRPVRRFDIRLVEKRQNLIGVLGQVVLKLQVAVMRKVLFKKTIQSSFQQAAGHGQSVRADYVIIAPITKSQGIGE